MEIEVRVPAGMMDVTVVGVPANENSGLNCEAVSRLQVVACYVGVLLGRPEASTYVLTRKYLARHGVDLASLLGVPPESLARMTVECTAINLDHWLTAGERLARCEGLPFDRGWVAQRIARGENPRLVSVAWSDGRVLSATLLTGERVEYRADRIAQWSRALDRTMALGEGKPPGAL